MSVLRVTARQYCSHITTILWAICLKSSHCKWMKIDSRNLTEAFTSDEMADGTALYYWTRALHLHSRISFSLLKSIYGLLMPLVSLLLILLFRRLCFFIRSSVWCSSGGCNDWFKVSFLSASGIVDFSLNKKQSLIITEFRQLCCISLVTLLKIFLYQLAPVTWLQLLSEFYSKV